MANRIQIRRRGKYAAEARTFVFDFQDFPELAEDTIASAAVAASPVGPTLGTAAVTTDDLEPGEGDPTVPAGKGVRLAVSGGVAGTSYLLTCTATMAGGSVLVVKGWLDVNSDT